jgi:hypothetical protein
VMFPPLLHPPMIQSLSSSYYYTHFGFLVNIAKRG